MAPLSVAASTVDEMWPEVPRGGEAEDERTRRWYRELAGVIGATPTVITFEPDSLGTVDCHARHRRDDRLRLLRYGVKQLTQLPNITLYIEAGASDWEPARRMARKLRRVGIGMARIHAQCHPHRLDACEHPLRARALPSRGRQALRDQHRPERTRARALPQGRTPDPRLVQPRPARSRTATHDEHLTSEGGRLPLDKPSRLRSVLFSRQDRMEPGQGPHFGQVRDALRSSAEGHPTWPPQALSEQRVQHPSLERAKRLFPESGQRRRFEPTDSLKFDSGVRSDVSAGVRDLRIALARSCSPI